ncbi:MAG: sugar phosphate isomerase/epimerase [Acidimicrobiales bacterium]
MSYRFGVDLITFYHPSFWGEKNPEGFEKQALAEPNCFWDRIVESVTTAGIEGVELTFPPGDWATAVKTYGSSSEFAKFLMTSGISVISGFFSGFEYAVDLFSDQTERQVIKDAKRYAEFLAGAGADVIVAGMPMRKLGNPERPAFVDLDYAQKLAALINRVGAATLSEGVRLALHPEVGSVFCARRDIDLFLLLTDAAYVDFCPDTAHIFLGGASPVDVLRDHYERITIAHWKDAVGRWPSGDDVNERRFELEADYFRRVGTGDVDWTGWANGLERAGFEGWAILELDAAPNPIEDMTAAREFVVTLTA